MLQENKRSTELQTVNSVHSSGSLLEGSKYFRQGTSAAGWSALQYSTSQPKSITHMMREAKREWTFCVSAKTLPGESVFVVGNCGELGSWSNKGALLLNKDEEERDDEGLRPVYYVIDIREPPVCRWYNTMEYLSRNFIWSGICKIPCDRDVFYRYFVGVVIVCDDQSQSTPIVVRRWETNVMPRTVHKGVLSNVNTVLEPHTFGMYDGVKMVDRGWLTSETAVQFKLFNNPIQLWKRKFEGRKVFVKLTPIQLRQRKISEIPSDVMDESLDTQDPPEQQERWPITEISVMNNEEWEFKLQDQFGRVYNPDDCIIFQVSLHHPESVDLMAIKLNSLQNGALQGETKVFNTYVKLFKPLLQGDTPSATLDQDI